MKVAFLTDAGNQDGTIGGAELTMREFVRTAPEDVKFTALRDAETVVIGNCVTFSPDSFGEFFGERMVWYHNDLSPHIEPALKAWLDKDAEHIFCSPLQRERYGLDGHLIPPAINLDAFKPTRQKRRNGNRKGMVSIGAWQNPGKGQMSLSEYAQEHGPVDVYGTGIYAPHGPNLDYKGPLEPEQVAQTLWSYERFVFLPWDVEPFGRCVVEAWAAGLELVINKLVGARYWLEEQPEKLKTAAEDFWGVVRAR